MKNFLLMMLFLASSLQGVQDEVVAPSRTNPAVERWELVTDVYIGIDTRALSPDEIEACGENLTPDTGLLITRVTPGSPAEEGGLRAGDVIMIMSGACINSPAALAVAIRNAKPGVPMFFRVLRNGERLPFRVVPTKRDKPVVIGYLTPSKLNADNVDQIRPIQAEAGLLLVREKPPLAEIQAKMGQISELLSNSYARGNLRLAFTAKGCTISTIRYKTHIAVTMEENGTETSCELRREGDALPEAMRQRLRMMLGAEGG